MAPKINTCNEHSDCKHSIDRHEKSIETMREEIQNLKDKYNFALGGICMFNFILGIFFTFMKIK